MTFGTATTAAGVREYLVSVRGGRPAPEEVVLEFERRYDVVGRSPLLEITLAQAAGLQAALNAAHGEGSFEVAVGMLHSAPGIDAAAAGLVEHGARRIVGLVLAPQYSSLILSGYERAVSALRGLHPDVQISVAGPWHTLPEWTGCLAERVESALQALPEHTRATIPVIFTAHSLPKAVVERDPAYIEQLRQTAAAVAQSCALDASRWVFAYQSAGHTAEEWLRPDVKELLPGMRAGGHDAVLVAPVQFVADHLEILYDLDVAAADEARSYGVQMHRIAMPNATPAFIAALTAVVERELSAAYR
ncbi:MAG: ferrochelatase [Candidatus Dormibacteraeota bacterium]|nr:ferrochelatase [Candidatus Dormibacteraeota bacterium]